MSHSLRSSGPELKTRNPVGVWLLAAVTFGIYGFVWLYKVNEEARVYLKDEMISPAKTLLGIVPGALLIVPALVSYYRTAQRIQRMQMVSGLAERISPIGALVLVPIYGLYFVYLQVHLNRLSKFRRLQVEAGYMLLAQAGGVVGEAPQSLTRGVETEADHEAGPSL